MWRDRYFEREDARYAREGVELHITAFVLLSSGARQKLVSGRPIDPAKEQMNRSTLACVLVVFSIASIATSSAGERVRIGVSTALSGGAAAYGEDVKNAIIFANDQLGDAKYDLVVEDDQCSDRQAVTIANKFVSQDKIKYVLGFGCSGAILAAAPVYEKAKVVVVASGAGAPAISNSGDYIFRTKPSLTIAAKLLGRDVAKKFKKVGVVSEETAYCQGLADAFSAEAESRGIQVLKVNYTPHTEDFQTILVKLKAAGVEAVFLNPQTESGLVSLYKQVQGLQMKAQIYGNFHPGSPTFLSAFGSSADGVIFTDIAFNDQYLNTKGLSAIEAYEKRFGKPKSSEHFVTLSILAFDAVDEAIKSGGDVKNYLYSQRFENMVQGGFSFDTLGDPAGGNLTYTLKVLRNGAASKL